MLVIGEENRPNPTVHVPPWSIFDESTDGMIFSLPVSGISANVNGNANGGRCSGEYSPFMSAEALTALQRYLNEADTEADVTGRESDIPIDAFSCDEFRMYEFKVRRCARGRSHDWTECPYAHPGEKARRRDPRKFHYSGTACPDFRKGNCKRGDSCEYAHGVFECWLHPARYRTQPCKDGTNCRRRVCFFAHTQEQLRVLSQQNSRTPFVAESPPSYDGSPLRQALDSYFARGSPNPIILSSPPISPPSDSPPMSPSAPSLNRSPGSNSVSEVVASLRNLQLCRLKSAPICGVQGGSGFVSPRGGSTLRPVFDSLPSTPTRTLAHSGIGYLDFWDRGSLAQEESTMDRVESGRGIRAKIFEKLSRENSFEREGRVDPAPSPATAPDVGWVSELVK